MTSPRGLAEPPPIKYLCIGHQSQDVHVGSDGSRSDPEHGGASLYTALTAWLLTGDRVAVVSSTEPEARGDTSGGPDAYGLETSANPAGEQTIFEDWVEGDFRRQRLVSRAPAIDSSFGAIGPRARNASVVFAAPLLDELPHDCRSWFWADFACLIPQGWFRSIGSDGSIALIAPDASRIVGPWDLVVLSQEEALFAGDLESWRRITRILAVTRGRQGATVYADGAETYVAPFEMEQAVDPTGAGDVWSAAFAIRYNETHNIEQAGRFASAAAAICVSRPGLRGVPESRHEVEELMATRRDA